MGGMSGSAALFGVVLILVLAANSTQGQMADRERTTGGGTPDSELRAQFPGIQIERDGHGRIQIFGVPMTEGATDLDAADRWIAHYAAVLGITPFELALEDVTPLSNGMSRVFAYRQRVEGLPVEGGIARILVGDQLPIRVTYAAAHLALPPAEGYPPVLVTLKEATAIARGALPGADTLHIGLPELVIQPSATLRRDSRRVWRIEAADQDPSVPRAWSAVIDAASGAILEVRDEIRNIDVLGEVRALVTPANRPDVTTNPPVEQWIPGVEVGITGGASVLTDEDGSFSIPHGGTGSVLVTSILEGNWVRVLNSAGPNLVALASVTPPGPLTLNFNPVTDQHLQAQVNGFVYTNMSHDFFRDRTTGIPGIDVQIPCHVNIFPFPDFCNAFFSPVGQSLHFIAGGAGCVNSAYSSVIAHEYGHFVVDRLGLSQGAFGEGFGDVVSMLMFDDPRIGREFSGPGTVVRDPSTADVQYPCFGPIHSCGQLLGGVWWDIREEFGDSLGLNGLEEARQLFSDWSLFTTGDPTTSSATPTTAVEVLIVDDDDGILANGTPHFDEICAAFGAHSIVCPTITVPLAEFKRGDVDGDGILTLVDPISILYRIFQGVTIPCFDAADVNDDGSLDLADVLGGLSIVFGLVPTLPLRSLPVETTRARMCWDALRLPSVRRL